MDGKGKQKGDRKSRPAHPFGLERKLLLLLAVPDLDGQGDRTISGPAFGDSVAASLGIGMHALHRVGLQKAAEVLLVAPLATGILYCPLARGRVEHHGVLPSRQLYGETFDRAAGEFGFALYG